MLCDLFMSKVLGLGFFLLQSKYLLVFIIFGLGIDLETNQTF
jgi:hypothetical protein